MGRAKSGERVTLQLNFSRQAELLSTVRTVAGHYYGALGTFYYDAFEVINERHFGGDLPVPLLQVAMTPYGKCIAYTLSEAERQPVIRMHPKLLRGARQGQAGGLVYIYDVLLHELCHVAVGYLIGAGKGDTSHNCEGWCELVNQISPALGLVGIDAQRTKPIRNGKAVSKITLGNVSQGDLGAWPHAQREQQHPGYYSKAELDFEVSVPVSDVLAEARRYTS